MRKRSAPVSADYGPPKKKTSTASQPPSVDIEPGEILTDIVGKEWKVGKAVGLGGFGEIFLASDDVKADVDENCQYVVKIESHTNGPLFVEINCYLRIAKETMIEEWKRNNNNNELGMPNYVASGSHCVNKQKYRFLILPRYKADLEKIIEEKRSKLNLKTVLMISLQLIDVLEYIHSKGFVHGDIKASNLMLGRKPRICTPRKKEEGVRLLFRNCSRHIHGPIRTCRILKTLIPRTLRSNQVLHYVENVRSMEPEKGEQTMDHIYLLDYGLASKYLLSSGEHKKYCVDQRRAHAGTVLFCSIDAHNGANSRRSDLETLGYNIIYWLTHSLPWLTNLDDPEIVHKKKQRCLNQVEKFLDFCFGQYPKFLLEFFNHLKRLEFKSKPDYAYCRKLFRKALSDYGYMDNGKLDFDNLEGWGCVKRRKSKENALVQHIIVNSINRMPLKSNLPIKPVLRKKNKKLNMLNWSRILMDPEFILKKSRERKNTDHSESCLSTLNIQECNPTQAMLDVYNSYLERNGNSPKYRGDTVVNHIEGYTYAMMQVYNRMRERRQMELEIVCNKKNNNHIRKTNRRPKVYKTKSVTRNERKPTEMRTRSTARIRIYSLQG